MLNLRSPGIVWNVTWGIQAVALYLWDQKWGVLIGFVLGGALSYGLLH